MTVHLFDTMVGKVSRRTCREVLRCQPTRCAPQARMGPVSCRTAYPEREPVTGNARHLDPDDWADCAGGLGSG